MMHPAPPASRGSSATSARHVHFGWWALLAFASLGLLLESLHGFKVDWYLGLAHETRRHLWTLAHAHGVLLALVNLGFGFTAAQFPDPQPRRQRFASTALLAASILLPTGFFLGGVWTYGGDPGLGVLMVPVGAVLLLLAVALTAVGVRAALRDGHHRVAPSESRDDRPG